tara:strand:- start:111 stop:554 length:444 start_codon:yes stop_codon:yes gene_type:complete
MKVICVTGTPGAGKTTLSKKLAKQLDFSYIDVNAMIEKQKMEEGVDKQRDAKIVDPSKLTMALSRAIGKGRKKNGVIIDSHMSHYLPKEKVDFVIVCKCDLVELKKRLEKKGYEKDKIQENMDAEIFDVCYNEAKEMGHKIVTYRGG